MRSFLNEISEKFQHLDDPCDKCDKASCECGSVDEIGEQSTSANAGAYNTPNAFTKKEKKKIEYPTVSESINQKYERIINTIAESYRDFKTDPSSTPAKKVNSTIREINQKLKEIESLAKNAARLKQEQGVTQDHYWRSSATNLENIGNRLIKISERIRALRG